MIQSCMRQSYVAFVLCPLKVEFVIIMQCVHTMVMSGAAPWQVPSPGGGHAAAAGVCREAGGHSASNSNTGIRH